MQKFDSRKDKNQALIWGFLAVAFVPALVWFTRDRPLSADSLPQMVELIKAREGERLDFQLKTPKADNLPSVDETQSRWRDWSEELQHKGCSKEEADAVIAAARKDAPTSPIFIQRAWLNSQQVWLFGGAIYKDRDVTWPCPPSLSALENDRRKSTHVWLRAVSTEAPYNLIDRTADKY